MFNIYKTGIDHSRLTIEKEVKAKIGNHGVSFISNLCSL